MDSKIQIEKKEMSDNKTSAESRDKLKILRLQNQFDLHNPDTALDLYEKLILDQTFFETELGRGFLKSLLHTAIHSESYLEDETALSGRHEGRRKKRVKEQRNRTQSRRKQSSRTQSSRTQGSRNQGNRTQGSQTQNNLLPIDKDQRSDRRKTKKKKKTVYLVFLLLFSCIFFYHIYQMVSYQVLSYLSAKKIDDLVNSILLPVESKNQNIALKDDGTQNQEFSVEETENDVLYEYSALYERNPDLIGWIRIEGTVINYPVMQTKEDEEYYLLRDFDRESDINGLPFMDARCDAKTDSNLIIYGHNMKNGSMFSALMNYAEEEFYKKHPVVLFDTIYEKGVYDIIAVFQTRVAYQDEDTFRYYNFIEPLHKAEFYNYLENISELSYYNTDQTVDYGDKLITLSTCDRSIEDGRLVVVARKRNS